MPLPDLRHVLRAMGSSSARAVERLPVQPLTRAQMAKARDDSVARLKVQLNTAHPPSNPHLRAHYTNLGAISGLLSRSNAPPPPLPSTVARAELDALATTMHPLAQYQKLAFAGDLTMDRLLALLHSPALKAESVIDGWATLHAIPAAHVVLKLCKLECPNKELLTKWIGSVPGPRVTIARAKLLDSNERQGHQLPYEQFSLRQLSVDLAAHMTYALQKRGPLWDVYHEWLHWKEVLVPEPDCPVVLRDGSYNHVLFMPTILLLRAVTRRRESQAILDAVLPLVTLPPRSPHTRDIFNRILAYEEWMADPTTATNVLFAASVYRPSLQFAGFVGNVVAELLKRPDALQDRDVQERVSRLVDMALEDCGSAGGGRDLARNELERARREIAKIGGDKKGKLTLQLPVQLVPTF